MIAYKVLSYEGTPGERVYQEENNDATSIQGHGSTALQSATYGCSTITNVSTLEGKPTVSSLDTEDTSFVHNIIIPAADVPKAMTLDPGLEEADLVYEVDDIALLSPPEPQYEFKPSHLPWKKVLMVTALWFPRTWMRVTARKIFVISVQSLMTVFLTSYFLLESGVRVPGSHWMSNIETDMRFPFTVAHCIIWEFRWLLTYILGVVYGHSRHLEKFVAHLKLPKSMMRKIIVLQAIYLILLLLVVLLMPCTLHWLELKRWGHVHFPDPLLDSMLFFLYRLVTIPSFCMVTYILYLNGCAILTMGGRLYRTDARNGINAAKREVLVTKRIISDTEAGLQYYLLFHFLMILLAAFTGIFSCVERLEFKTKHGNSTVFSIRQPRTQVQLRPDVQFRVMNLQRNIKENSLQLSLNNSVLLADEPMLMKLKQNEQEVKQTSLLLLDVLKDLQKGNHTSQTVVTSSNVLKRIPQFLNSSAVVFLSICSLLEVLVLYLVPIFLILWQNKCLREVRNNVIGLDTVIQKEGGYVFQNEDLKEEVIKYLEIVQPIRVWGYEVSIYRAIFLTCLAQIVSLTMKTVVTKIGHDL